VDFDNDGWTDLVVRRTGSVGDDFNAGGTRQTWLLRNTGKKSFEDVTEKSKIRIARAGTDPKKGRPGEVIVFADIDNDGDLDLYTGLGYDAKNKTAETSEILINQGDGTFALGPESSAIRVPTGKDVPAGASFVDYDRDGFVDLWVVQNTINNTPQQDRLYHNDGSGNFTDVTNNQGLTTKPWVSGSDLNAAKAHTIGWGATACDLNNDGNIELMSASYGRAPNHLWLANGASANFSFTNRSIDSGYAFDDRIDWTDNESARCWCKLHPTDEDCPGVPPPQYIVCNTDSDAFRWDHTTDRFLYRLGGNSASTICGDVNNDGYVDLLTSEIVHWDVGSSSDPAELMLNTKDPNVKFSRPGAQTTGLVVQHAGVDWNDGIMTGDLFDFDNDGWLDAYWGNSDYPGTVGLLFHQNTPGHFEAVPIDQGIDHHRSHGIAVADFDHDGDLDVVLGHSFSRCSGTECYPTQQIRLFENVIGQDGNYIQLKLIGGAGTNAAAIGARVTVKAGAITQIRDVEGGHGHYGAQDDLTVHVGIGTACQAEVTVRWPDSALTTQTFTVGGRISL
jgi:hypothetical protein